MKKYFIVSPHGRLTAKALAPLLPDVEFILTGQNNRVLSKKSGKFIKKDLPSIKNSIVVRWGSSRVIDIQDSIVYNVAEKINSVSNKRSFRVKSEETEIFRTPPLIEDIRDAYPDDFPIIVRPKKHAMGKDFYMFGDAHSLQLFMHNKRTYDWYMSGFVDKDREFRVHCASGKVLLIKEKPKPKDDNPLWNISQSGEAFDYIKWSDITESKLLKKVCNDALECMKYFGMDTGGVDVMTKGDDVYIIEINTTPSLHTADYSLNRWAAYFKILFEKESKFEAWDFSKFKKGSSLIWKNKQLNLK